MLSWNRKLADRLAMVRADRDEWKRMAEILAARGAHGKECNDWWSRRDPCNCGWADALKRYDRLRNG